MGIDYSKITDWILREDSFHPERLGKCEAVMSLGNGYMGLRRFLLPYYIFTDVEAARSLEEYRYLSLPGAHEKARHNGYKGAMFPWESAWLDDGEVTPEFMDVDIVTGKPIKVWSGIIEQHITSDVAYGAWQYAVITGDEEFMDKYGYELIMDTAKFWASRFEKTENDGRYSGSFLPFGKRVSVGSKTGNMGVL